MARIAQGCHKLRRVAISHQNNELTSDDDVEDEDWLKGDREKAMERFAFGVQRLTTTYHGHEGISNM